LSILFFSAWLLNCFLSASLGVIVGLLSRSHDDAASFTNFFIMPMAFFSGTFFPVEEMPWLVQKLIFILPLTHVNFLLRHPAWSAEAWLALTVIAGYGLLAFLAGVVLIGRYDE
jgi:ABC-type polysaccharide/polyol phosphate export permease